VSFSADDTRFMQRALELAGRGLYTTQPNPRVGCVLAVNGCIVGEGWHQWAGQAHAEVAALAAAGEQARGATAYVTLEPCCHYGRTPPCTEALIAAGVRRVVAAMTDPNPQVAGKGLQCLMQAGIETASGLFEARARQLNPGFCQRMTTGRPWLRSKLAMSLDGRTALSSGESRWITSEASRQDVHRLRARSSALLTGIDTVLQDDARLTVRLDPAEPFKPPLRVVLDSRLRLPASAALCQGEAPTLVLTTASRDTIARANLPDTVRVLQVAADRQGRPDLDEVLILLGQMDCNEVTVEAGACLNGALLDSGLVDEWIIYQAPVVLGNRARGSFDLPDITRMADRHELTCLQTTVLGPDVRLTLCHKDRPANPDTP
jgi:diaminohydroxyphosphoribosylaminopyrimidine deaminase/5-amino-6-(5-phosphoribosylamino)uracil reductase